MKKILIKITPLILLIGIALSFSIPFIYFEIESESKKGEVFAIDITNQNNVLENLNTQSEELDFLEVAKLLVNAENARIANNVPMSEKSPEKLISDMALEIEELVNLSVLEKSDYEISGPSTLYVSTSGAEKLWVWEYIYQFGENEEIIFNYSSLLGKVFSMNIKTTEEAQKINQSRFSYETVIEGLYEYYMEEDVMFDEMKISQLNKSFGSTEYYVYLNEDISLYVNFYANNVFNCNLISTDEVSEIE